ncbi:MAG TPA: type II CAAX endopeptidase family protein [Acidimicrobiia bacterium]|nr:type II CAAX endopeptidase family protein [Acidimicrobiia bacterium]
MMESSAPPQRPQGYLPSAKWRIRDVFFAFVAGIAGSLVVTVAVVIAGADPLDPIPFSLVFLGQAAGSVVAIVMLSRSRGSGSLAADTGFVVKPGDWWGVPAGMLLQIAIALITAPFVFWVFGDDPPDQSVSEIAGASETLIEQLLIIAAVAVVAPIIEEIIFRGMLLSILRRSFGAWVSIIVSAAVFASVHLIDPNAIAVVPGLFALGIVLGWVTLRRGDLSLAIALHSGINLLAAITLLWGDELIDWSERQLEVVEGLAVLLPF